MSPQDEQFLMLLVLLVLWIGVKYRRPWRGSGDATAPRVRHGTCPFLQKDVRRKGLILGPRRVAAS